MREQMSLEAADFLRAAKDLASDVLGVPAGTVVDDGELHAVPC